MLLVAPFYNCHLAKIQVEMVYIKEFTYSQGSSPRNGVPSSMSKENH